MEKSVRKLYLILLTSKYHTISDNYSQIASVFGVIKGLLQICELNKPFTYNLWIQIATLEEIRTYALGAYVDDQTWHFHCMSPDCLLNTNDQYAFVLEIPETEEVLVYLSNQAEKELAAELSPLLHGNDVMDSNSTKDGYEPSDLIAQMSKRANDLNDRNIEWHHHMLYPNCIFNGYSPSHVLMLEDSSTGEAILSITDEDPKDDLKQIENLFFANRP